ncbi:MAG: DUF3291 domain-containing protein [Cocleimonas sp.]|nr:DUF3291 domain-containing protein [Cocleimonas sp.]
MNTTNKKYHLAQINIAQAKDEMDTETMHGFMSRIDEINAIADKTDGFIWRLQSNDGDSTSIRVFDDPLLLVNMSVWDNVDSLKNYVYKSLHVELIRDREAWFDKMGAMHQALWWIPVGHIPSIQEAKDKLELLRENGPNQDVFTFGKAFQKPE